jgi:hypothetical protein
MNKTIASTLMFLALIVVLSACSGPNCDSGTERKSGNLVTEEKGRDATIGTLCVDKAEYNTGDTVHMTFTVKNALDEQIVLGDGQQPVMNICPAQHQCLSQYQPDVAQLTHLVLEPGQSKTIQWDWPTAPQVDPQEALLQTNDVSLQAHWVRLDKIVGDVSVMFLYGPRKGMP